MARISTYLNDNSISGEDLLTGSNYLGINNYQTNTFKIKDLAEYFAGQTNMDPSVLSLKANGGLVYETVNSTNFLAVDLGASNITGQLANTDLANSYITINGTDVQLGGSISIPVGDITAVTAGTYLSGGGTTGDVTINHDSTSRSNTTASSTLAYNGTFTAISSVSSNATGHVTGTNLTTYTLPAGPTDAQITLDAGTYLSFGSGDGIFTLNQANNESFTINHDNTSRSDTTSTPSQLGYGGTFTAITSTTTNATGHLTAINTATYTLPASDNTDNFANSVAVTGSTTKTITIGRTGALADLTGTFTDNDTIPNDGLLDINEGTDISLTITGGDFTADKSTETDIVINHVDVTRTNTTDASTIAHGNTFTAITSLTSSARGHVTGAETTTYTMPAGPEDATIQIGAGTYLSGGGDFTTNQASNETLNINHNSTSRSDSTTSSTLSGGSTFTAITTASSNGTGHLTGVNTQTYTLPDTATGLEAIDSSSDAIIRLVRTGTDDEVKLEAGANITLNVDETNDTIEIVASGFGNVYEAASESAQLNLTTSQGDIVIRTDESKTYIRNNGTAGTMADYTELQFSGIQNINLTAGDGIHLSRTSLTQTNNNLTITNILATNALRGGIKLFNNTDQSTAANAVTTTANRTYGLQLNSSDQGVINVPWTDTVYTLPVATSSALGGIKIGYTENGKNYPVELDSEKAYVNVPWTDNNTQNTTTLSFVDSTDDIILRNTTGGAGSGDQDIKFVAGSNVTLTHTDANNIEISSTNTNTTYSSGVGLVLSGTTFKADLIDETLQSVTAETITTTASRTYAVMPDADGDLVVNVPWVDTDNNTDTKQTTADDTADADRFIHFVNNDAGAQTAGTNTGLKFNPSTERLTVTNMTVADMTVTGTQTINNVELVSTSNGIVFEGSTDDTIELKLVAANPTTTDKVVTIPDATFTIPTQDTTYDIMGSGNNHAAGLVLAGDATHGGAFLRKDGTWQVPPDEDTVYTLPLADDNTRGGVKIGYSENGKNYPVELSSEKMYVNVPWTDNNTEYTAGDGLRLDGTKFNIEGSEIAANVNLNTMTTTGWYSQNSNSDATTALNYPTAHAGILEVINDDKGNGKHTVQRYSRYNASQVWHRYRYDVDDTAQDSDWSNWVDLAADTNTNQLTTFKVRDDDNDEATIGQDKFIKFVSAVGTAGTNLSGTGTSSDPFVMTITNPDTVASTVWNLIDGDGTSKAINDGKHVKFIEGNDIDINYTDVDNGTSSDPFDLKFTHKNTTRTNTASDEGTLSYGGTISAISALTSNARGHVTEVTTSTWQLPAAYSHPTHAGDDINIDTGALTGAYVISDLDFNITTNTLGHVTDANGTISTRQLTPSDIGAATDDHTHPASDITSGTFNVNRYLKPTSGDWWNNGVGIVGTDGVMEIGRYIDFHHSDTTTADYSVRLDCESANVLNVVGGSLEVDGHTVWDENDFTATNVSNWNTAYGDKVNSMSFNTSNGVLTLTRQDGGTVTEDLDGRYVLDTGDTVNGTLRIASSGWLTAEGNVTSYPPNSQGLAFGWNRSGGSRESEILFSGGTTSHGDATLYIRSFVAGDEGVSPSEVQYLKFGASDQAIVVDSTKKLMFNNSNTYINSPSNTNLDISASNRIKLTGATVESHASNDLEFWTNSNKRFEILSDGSAKFYGGLTIEGCLVTGDDCPTTFENLIAGDNSNNYSSTNKPPAADLNDNGTWDGAQFKFKGGIYIPHRIYHFQSSEFSNNSAANPYDLSYRIFSHNFFIVPQGKYILLPYKRWGRPTGTVSKYGGYVDNNANTWLDVTNFSQNDGPNFNRSGNVPAKNYKMNITGVNGSAPSPQDPIVLDYRQHPLYSNQWQIKVSGQQNLSNITVSFHNFYIDRRSDPETSATNVPDYNDIPEGTTITIVGGANILGVIGNSFAKIGLAQNSNGEAFVEITNLQSSYYDDFMDAGGTMEGAGKVTAVTLTYVRQHTWPDATYKHGSINEDTHLQNVYGWVATSIADTRYDEPED